MKPHEKDDLKAESLSERLADPMDRTALDPEAQLPFVSVPLARFVLMSLVTFSLYEVWWFYANWKRVKDRTGDDIWPVWRALFAPLFCYQLVQTVRSTAEKVSVPVSLSAGAIALSYLAILVAGERLPDPWFWVGALSFAPLVPVVLQIENLHQTVYPGLASHAPFGKGHVVTLLVGLPIVGLVLVGTTMPPTKVLSGTELPDGYRETLIELGHVRPEERILYFYSGGIFSIEEDGNLVTDQRVVSYESGDDGLWRRAASYSEISDLEVVWSDSELDDTIVYVTTVDGDTFSLFASPEEEGDHLLVGQIETLRTSSVRDASASIH